MKLILLNSSKKGRAVALKRDRPLTIGRGACTLKLVDSRVSRRHAQIAFQHGSWLLQDLGSTNGTTVNGEPVDRLVELEPGDVIQVGRLKLRCAASAAPPAVAAPEDDADATQAIDLAVPLPDDPPSRTAPPKREQPKRTPPPDPQPEPAPDIDDEPDAPPAREPEPTRGPVVDQPPTPSPTPPPAPPAPPEPVAADLLDEEDDDNWPFDSGLDEVHGDVTSPIPDTLDLDDAPPPQPDLDREPEPEPDIDQAPVLDDEPEALPDPTPDPVAASSGAAVAEPNLELPPADVAPEAEPVVEPDESAAVLEPIADEVTPADAGPDSVEPAVSDVPEAAIDDQGDAAPVETAEAPTPAADAPDLDVPSVDAESDAEPLAEPDEPATIPESIVEEPALVDAHAGLDKHADSGDPYPDAPIEESTSTSDERDDLGFSFDDEDDDIDPAHGAAAEHPGDLLDELDADDDTLFRLEAEDVEEPVATAHDGPGPAAPVDEAADPPADALADADLDDDDDQPFAFTADADEADDDPFDDFDDDPLTDGLTGRLDQEDALDADDGPSPDPDLAGPARPRTAVDAAYRSDADVAPVLPPPADPDPRRQRSDRSKPSVERLERSRSPLVLVALLLIPALLIAGGVTWYLRPDLAQKIGLPVASNTGDASGGGTPADPNGSAGTGDPATQVRPVQTPLPSADQILFGAGPILTGSSTPPALRETPGTTDPNDPSGSSTGTESDAGNAPNDEPIDAAHLLDRVTPRGNPRDPVPLPRDPSHGTDQAGNTPSEPSTAATPVPGDGTAFLVDASGSMIDTQDAILEYLRGRIDTLADGERFTILFFREGEVVEPANRTMITAGPGTRTGTRLWLDPQRRPVESVGRSDPDTALDRLRALRPADVVLISDDAFGRLPGLDANADPVDLLANLDAALADTGATLHTVQFFYDDDRNLLERLASTHGGTFTRIDPTHIDPLSAVDAAVE